MCNTLVEIRESLGCYSAGFDGSLLSGADAGAVVELASAIERMAATVKGLAAVRSAETGFWKAAGDRSAVHHLARTTGTSVTQAAEVIETARRLSQLPAVSVAARSGELSAQQAAAVAGAAGADPRSEFRLLAKARTSSLAELREECARIRAAAEPDPEARRRAIHDGRYLRNHTDDEGAWHLRMRDNPEVGAEIMAVLEPIRNRLFSAARAEGRHEPVEAYAADALAELARGGATAAASGPRQARPRPKIIARVDLLALLRGRPVDGEVCELVGYGPVAASAIRDLIDTGDPFLAAVVTKGTQVVGVAHLARRATAAQQTALEWLYPSCAVEGCAAVAFLENDHRVDWAASHRTVFDLLDRLCSHHHDLKTIDNWALVTGRGKRAFVPPDDPRHPRHAHGPPVAA